MTGNKRYTTDNGSNEDVCLVDNVTGKEFESDFDEIVDLLNEQDNRIKELEKDNFSFTFTEDYEKINNNKLEVLDKHTMIQMNGDRIHIVVIPPKSKPYSFNYYITGITFVNEIKDGDVDD